MKIRKYPFNKSITLNAGGITHLDINFHPFIRILILFLISWLIDLWLTVNGVFFTNSLLYYSSVGLSWFPKRAGSYTSILLSEHLFISIYRHLTKILSVYLPIALLPNPCQFMLIVQTILPLKLYNGKKID